MKSIAQHVLLITILSSLFQATSNFPLIQTNKLKFYRTSSNIRLDQQFTITFHKDYSRSPVFVYGMSQYYLGAVQIAENVSNFLSFLSNKQAKINVTSFGATNAQWLSITYFSVEESNGFLSDSVEDGYIASGVLGSHYNQTYVIKKNLALQAENYSCLPLLRGFLWSYSKLAKEFGLSIAVTIASNISYIYRINVPANFTAQNVAFDVLFFNLQFFTQLQVVQSTTLVYAIAETDQRKNSIFQRIFEDCKESVMLLGLNGFLTDNYLANRQIGWKSQCYSNFSNNSGLLSVGTSNWKKVEFAFLQFRIAIQQTNMSKNTDKNPINNNPINNNPINNNPIPIYALVLGVVGGILVIVTVGVIIKRSCKMGQRSEIVQQQNFRSFPTISL